MDKKTQRELNKVNASIPKHLMDRLLKVQKPEDNSEAIRNLMKSKAIDDKTKQKLRANYDAGNFQDKERTVVDQKVASQIDSFVEKRVRNLMKKGIIQPAKRDQFMRRNGL